jgi:hypothetical protein
VSIPPVNLAAVVLATVVISVVGFVYYAFVAPRLAPGLGGSEQPEATPARALAIATFSRFVIVLGMAVVVGWAAAATALAGAAVGLILAVANTLTITIGMVAFGRLSWRDYVLGVPQILAEWAIAGAILATVR